MGQTRDPYETNLSYLQLYSNCVLSDVGGVKHFVFWMPSSATHGKEGANMLIGLGHTIQNVYFSWQADRVSLAEYRGYYIVSLKYN